MFDVQKNLEVMCATFVATELAGVTMKPSHMSTGTCRVYLNSLYWMSN